MKYKLKEICLKVTDGSHYSPKAQDEGYPMFSVKDMLEYGFDYTNCKRINADDYERMLSSGCVPQKGDVLVAKDGSYLKEIFVCTETKEEAILSSIAIFRPNQEIVNPYFLCYLLKSPQVYNYISQNCVSGSALPRIVLKAFKEVVMDVPEMDVQLKIVSLLKNFDDKIQYNNQINRNLSEQAKVIFEQELLKFDSVPEGWGKGTLIDIADYLNGLAMQKYRPADDEDGLPVLKIKELRQGFCDESSELCSPKVKQEYIIHDGDVIFSWSGSLLVDFWCGGKCGLNQHLFKVTSKKYDKWFYYAWTLYHLDRFVAVAADKATTMGHIKREELSKAEVLIPDGTSYRRISKSLGSIYDMIVSNRVANRKLASLRDELLPKLMLGEINVSEFEL